MFFRACVFRALSKRPDYLGVELCMAIVKRWVHSLQVGCGGASIATFAAKLSCELRARLAER